MRDRVKAVKVSERGTLIEPMAARTERELPIWMEDEITTIGGTDADQQQVPARP